MYVFLSTPGIAGSVAGGSDLSQTCHLQAFLDHYAAVPRELIHHQMPRFVPTGQREPATSSSMTHGDNAAVLDPEAGPRILKAWLAMAGKEVRSRIEATLTAY